MPFHTGSRVARMVEQMRTSTPTRNPFTQPGTADTFPGLTPEQRDRLGTASVQLLHGLGDLTKALFDTLDDNRQTGEDLAGLLFGIGQALREASADDERDAFL